MEKKYESTDRLDEPAERGAAMGRNERLDLLRAAARSRARNGVNEQKGNG